MSIQNVLFDLDGTLANTLPGIEHSVAAAITKVMPPTQIPSLRSFIGPPVREVFKLALGELDDEVLERLENEFRVSYDGGGWQKSVAYEGALETVSKLADLGLKSFVVTNKPLFPALRILEHLHLGPLLEDVISLTSKNPPFASKTDTVIQIIRKHGLDVDRTILVGDSQDDARAAQVAHLKFAAAAFGYGGAHEGDRPRQWVISSLPELLTIVR